MVVFDLFVAPQVNDMKGLILQGHLFVSGNRFFSTKFIGTFFDATKTFFIRMQLYACSDHIFVFIFLCSFTLSEIYRENDFFSLIFVAAQCEN